MGYMMRAVVFVAHLGLLRGFSPSFSKEDMSFDMLRSGFSLAEGTWKVQEQQHIHRRLVELPSNGSFGFSTTTVLKFCANAYFDIEGQVTDSDIREAVFYHWNAESSGIKVIVADTLSGGDTEACSVTYGNLTSGSGVENDEFHGTQYTVEIFNAPPPAGSQYASAADKASTHIDYLLQETPERFLSSFCEAAGIQADSYLASLGFLVTWEDSVGIGSSNSAATGTEEQDVGDALKLANETRIYWPWWGWLIYAAIMALCFAPPMFIYVFRWRKHFEQKESKLVGPLPTKTIPTQEGLTKIHSPKWGITEVDFSDGDINVPNNVMVMEMGAMGRGYEFARQPLQTVPGRETPHDISNLAWGQVRRAKVVNGDGITNGGTLVSMK